MGTSEWIWLIECVLGYLRTQDMILSNLNSYTPLLKILLDSLYLVLVYIYEEGSDSMSHPPNIQWRPHPPDAGILRHIGNRTLTETWRCNSCPEVHLGSLVDRRRHLNGTIIRIKFHNTLTCTTILTNLIEHLLLIRNILNLPCALSFRNNELPMFSCLL